MWFEYIKTPPVVNTPLQQKRRLKKYKNILPIIFVKILFAIFTKN